MMATDRFEIRKAETKELIQQAFITLLQEKAFDEITVREVAEHAGIGFKTFYRHYKDKTELTNKLVSNFIVDLSQHLAPPTSLEACIDNLRQVLVFVRDNATTVRAIRQTPSKDDLISPLVQFGFAAGLQLQIVASEESEGQPRDNKRQELMAHHFVHSQLSLFYWWALDDLAMPLEEMVEMITALIIRPIWALSEPTQTS